MNLQEQKLRKLIKKGIKIVLERKKNQNREEERLRKVIRQLIPEVERKTAVADKVIHKNTGINVLDALLKRIINQIEDSYTNLSSNEKQRKSFRYHFLINFKNALAPVDANRAAPNEEQMELTEQDFKITVEDDDDDITSKPDESKFLPSRSKDIEEAEEGVAKEEEEEFVKLETDDPDVMTGAEEAENAWNDVQNQVISAYERLISATDAEAFKDWGLTNLKLYFDKFEGEMTTQIGDEPASPDYPPPEDVPAGEEIEAEETEEEFEI